MIPKYMQPEINIECEFDFCHPHRAHESDAGADLASKEDVYLTKDVRTLIKTGVKVEIPVGFVGLLFPRSSLSKLNITMTNSVGVIDSSYRGEIMASLMYIGLNNNAAIGFTDSVFITAGQKIVQLVILPITLPVFNIVDKLTDTVRGTGGFGSTGT